MPAPGAVLFLRGRLAAIMLASMMPAMGTAQGPGTPTIAGGLSVAPIQLSLNSIARSVSTIVSNPGDEPLTVQVRLFRWTMHGEEEVYTPPSDAGFSPPLFRLEPHATQAVRIVAKVPPGTVERSYRLVVDQLPLADAPGQLQLPVRMVLPVFVEPTAGISRSPVLQWSARYDTRNQQVTLSVSNRGAVHARVVGLSVEAGGKTTVVAAGLAGYALAGEEREWSYKAGSVPDTLTITANIGAAPVRAAVPVTR